MLRPLRCSGTAAGPHSGIHRKRVRAGCGRSRGGKVRLDQTPSETVAPREQDAACRVQGIRTGGSAKHLAAELLGRHWAQGVTLYLLGDFAAARALLEPAKELQKSTHRAAYAAITANDPYASTLIYLALTLTLLGYIDQARQNAVVGLGFAGL
jgi:hypothetical protein